MGISGFAASYQLGLYWELTATTTRTARKSCTHQRALKSEVEQDFHKILWFAVAMVVLCSLSTCCTLLTLCIPSALCASPAPSTLSAQSAPSNLYTLSTHPQRRPLLPLSLHSPHTVHPPAAPSARPRAILFPSTSWSLPGPVLSQDVGSPVSINELMSFCNVFL